MKHRPDAYFPRQGDTRYAVDHYALELDYKLTTNRLSGTATLSVRALEPLSELRLDLYALHVDSVRVAGRQPKKFTQRERCLIVRLAKELDNEQTVEVVVRYSGKPSPVPGLFGPAGWEELTDGLLVASQPYGAPSWFPCNDRADDKATYRVTLTSDVGYEAISNGRLIAQTTRGGRTTWVWHERRPMSPYLATLAIGPGAWTDVPAASTTVRIVHPRNLKPAASGAFSRLGDMVDTLTGWFGDYPFDQYTAAVSIDELEIPLEAQGLAHFGTNHVPDGWENERLVVHELAHQWFGNAVTAERWNDIWLHEGFACYTEWLWSEHRGLATADQRAAEHWQRLGSATGRLTAPGASDMFDDWVYKRGALTLHALRAAMGDRAFFELLRAWVDTHRYGTATTADFRALASRYAPLDVTALLDAWLDEPAVPPLPQLSATATR